MTVFPVPDQARTVAAIRAEVRQMVTEELDRLCEAFGIHGPFVRPPAPMLHTLAEIRYEARREAGKSRLVEQPRGGSMTAAERQKMNDTTAAIYRKLRQR